MRALQKLTHGGPPRKTKEFRATTDRAIKKYNATRLAAASASSLRVRWQDFKIGVAERVSASAQHSRPGF